jgi:transposase
MNCLRDLIYRLRSGESERQIAHDVGLCRMTVRKYRDLAEAHGFLQPDRPLLDEEALAAALGPGPQPPHLVSTVEPYREIVQRLLDQQVEMTAIYQRLHEDHGYPGSYSAIRRFVHQLAPKLPDAVVRVHTAPGEELQVDFGSVGPLFDPGAGHPRTAYVFVATLCFSRHQYAELVFDQKVPTWIALHRRAFESFERCARPGRARQSQGGGDPMPGVRPRTRRGLSPDGAALRLSDQPHPAGDASTLSRIKEKPC